MDIRRRRTRLRLQTALRSLLSEKCLADISVGELSQRAGVTRPTFYSNYSDLAAMLGEYLDGLLAEIETRHEALLAEQEDSAQEGRLAKISARIFADLDRDDPRLHTLLQGVPALTPEARFAALVERMIKRGARHDMPAPTALETTVAAHFYTGAFLGMVRLWVSRPNGVTADELGRDFARIVFHGRHGGQVSKGSA
ncbi:TetR/AcrR family transcriptional regulator [Lutimaribacter sp. EGI FJ00015]|uniref:TetR/AcrR family transcriptional regulator n=1 Tax=Lutimaribacter degradans TaxID=2945989 RepID=A0ACC6A1P0_9RHOB|nr:TetR/AcrR family transcriptional regulator [Lutimaribacter sp. EGI FJ00013]MCM2563664.1 TetR/AcrR family transcriptional regulator [Lutimaribacter sp. EGI FJ00013]MCO0614800.1 TetR/AcrR family transcriptional regulator [Lutimaribacter sp. EGI FJ00015]MCO0637516.1 TetR/AcrR family transcriptional regulator [Lutimaribacter sp. EGI FJ00014]